MKRAAELLVGHVEHRNEGEPDEDRDHGELQSATIPAVIVATSRRSTARARELARAGERAILGLVGAPGGGKSTLAAALVAELGDAAVLVPMDGFHLAQTELVRLGTRDRMGAPDTFDAAGYVALLRRLRARARPSTRPSSAARPRSRSRA